MRSLNREVSNGVQQRLQSECDAGMADVSGGEKTPGVAILGATGTIGKQTLSVIDANPGRYDVVVLTANTDVEALLEQTRRYQPKFAVMADERAAEQLRQRIRNAGMATEVLAGEDALNEICAHDCVDIVVAGIVGAIGLLSLVAAVDAGKRVLLANKEPLVMLGAEIIRRAEASGAELLPIDSEHNAIFQCLPIDAQPAERSQRTGNNTGTAQPNVSGVERIMLTGSGGPFRQRDIATFSDITVTEAVNHPNWQMGPKISVDSATMMNKGLEVIEAIHLFALPVDKIDVVVHPQSVIHSMVEFIDGSVVAELATPDMRVPIAHALGWPHRIRSGADSLNFSRLADLSFESPDINRFPCLHLARQATERGGTATTVLNAANEVAVEAFLAKQIKFTDIVEVIDHSLTRVTVNDEITLETVLQTDAETRRLAWSAILNSSGPPAASNAASPLPMADSIR